MSDEVFDILFHHWSRSFILTLAVEVPLALLLARLFQKNRMLALGVLSAVGTCLTHPLFWFYWSRLISNYVVFIASGELLVVLVEAAVFFIGIKELSIKRALLFSLALNSASYLLGLIVPVG